MKAYDADLLRRVKARDEAALAEFALRIQDEIRAQVYNRMNGGLRRMGDTIDIVDSVVADALAAVPRFQDRGELPFYRWLSDVTNNKINGKFRKLLFPDGGQRESLVPEATFARPDAAPGPSTCAAESDERAFLRRLISELPRVDGLIVQMHVFGELSFREIGERLAIEEDTASKKFRRAVEKLRALATKPAAPPSGPAGR